MPKVIVACHSRGGNTRAMAELAAEGARAEGAAVTLAGIPGLEPGLLVDFDGIVIGSPTYYGTMSAEVKLFLDETIALHGRLAGKAGGAFSSAANTGGGSETTVLAIINAMLIHGMVVQGSEEGGHYGPVAVGAPDERAAGECRELGRRVARLAGKLAGGDRARNAAPAP